jgi:hypothetical protein
MPCAKRHLCLSLSKKSFRIKKSRSNLLIFSKFFSENFYQNFFCEAAGFSTME